MRVRALKLFTAFHGIADVAIVPGAVADGIGEIIDGVEWLVRVVSSSDKLVCEFFAVSECEFRRGGE